MPSNDSSKSAAFRPSRISEKRSSHSRVTTSTLVTKPDMSHVPLRVHCLPASLLIVLAAAFGCRSEVPEPAEQTNPAASKTNGVVHQAEPVATAADVDVGGDVHPPEYEGISVAEWIEQFKNGTPAERLQAVEPLESLAKSRRLLDNHLSNRSRCPRLH